ncbi:hypothetical protein ACOMHN_010061 [Nucella lapillus]
MTGADMSFKDDVIQVRFCCYVPRFFLLGFMVYFLGMTSMYILCAISVDRYVVIAKPLLGAKITHKIRSMSRNQNWDKNSRIAKRNMKVEKKMAKTIVVMLTEFWNSLTALDDGGCTTPPDFHTERGSTGRREDWAKTDPYRWLRSTSSAVDVKEPRPACHLTRGTGTPRRESSLAQLGLWTSVLGPTYA